MRRPAKQLRVVIESELYSCDAVMRERRVMPFLRSFKKLYPGLAWHKAVNENVPALDLQFEYLIAKERKEQILEKPCTISISRV